jgi:4-hydroxyphenylacetate 3-monooxygenase/4-hydroxybutyryl-CoA dehydratase/vinylacetyl-CoA-Delta-isomerase
MRRNVQTRGERIDRDDSYLMPGINTISLTHDVALNPENEDLMTAFSPLINCKIGRFTHLNQNTEDLLKKIEMVRVLCQKVGGCIQRCMGVDALNSFSVVTHQLDEKFGTEYHKRFINYLKDFQQNDVVAAAAMTDVKGDRNLRPHQQVDPDLYLRIVEKKSDGIVVRGAKAHNSMAPYAEELMVLPTRALTKEEKDYAVGFSIPADSDGVKLIIKMKTPPERKKLKSPMGLYGSADCLTIFDDVFVPWERVFVCGEWEYASLLTGYFATFHRHSYCGCKPGTADIFMGAAALISEYNGLKNISHIRDKIVDFIMIAELVYACGIAAAIHGRKTSSGTYLPDIVYSNIGRCWAGQNFSKEYELLIDIAGGLAQTIPFEEDYLDPKTHTLLEKYLRGVSSIPTEDRLRCLNLIHDLTASQFAGGKLVAGIHGGGAPQMERVAIYHSYDLESKKKLAKYLAGINLG